MKGNEKKINRNERNAFFAFKFAFSIPFLTFSFAFFLVFLHSKFLLAFFGFLDSHLVAFFDFFHKFIYRISSQAFNRRVDKVEVQPSSF